MPVIDNRPQSGPHIGTVHGRLIDRRSPEKMETNIGGLVTFFQMLCMKAEAHQRRPKEDGAALQGKQFLSLTLSL
jgi:hypothetical protein